MFLNLPLEGLIKVDGGNRQALEELVPMRIFRVEDGYECVSSVTGLRLGLRKALVWQRCANRIGPRELVIRCLSGDLYASELEFLRAMLSELNIQSGRTLLSAPPEYHYNHSPLRLQLLRRL